MYKILLIDDDTDVLEINKKFLEKERFQVEIASNAQSGLHKIQQFHPDCIVLDVMMPNINGFSACKKYRSITNVPIIFLTGCNSEDNMVRGFQLGADDYLEKPYSLRELVVRIQANLRRSNSYNSPSNRNFGALTIDLNTHKAYCGKNELALSNREFELLRIFSEHPNELLTFEQISFEIFDNYSDSERRLIMVGVSRLRKKMESYPELNGVIETVWSRGYKFTPRLK